MVPIQCMLPTRLVSMHVPMSVTDFGLVLCLRRPLDDLPLGCRTSFVAVPTVDHGCRRLSNGFDLDDRFRDNLDIVSTSSTLLQSCPFGLFRLRSRTGLVFPTAFSGEFMIPLLETM